MNRRDVTLQKLSGIGILVLSIFCTMFSVKTCNGDVTPAIIMVPLGLYAIFADCSTHKSEMMKKK